MTPKSRLFALAAVTLSALLTLPSAAQTGTTFADEATNTKQPSATATMAPIGLARRDAPVTEEASSTGAHFFSFRSSWESPALKPNKKSWALFVGSHALAWTALALANHDKEHWGQEAPALGAVTAFDFAAFKFISPSFSIAAPIYGTQHYLRSR